MADQTPAPSTPTPPPPDKNPLKRLAQLMRNARGGGDVIAANVENSQDVTVGKNILKIRIGTLVAPATPVLIGIIVFIALAAVASYIAFVPARMPTSDFSPYFNVVVAEFGQLDAQGRAQPSPAGQDLSDSVYRALRDEFSTYSELKDLFNPLVWHGGPGLDKRVSIGRVSNITEARSLAESLGANVVVFGNFGPQGPASGFTPQFYIAPIRNVADDLVGAHRLGAPIQRAGLGLKAELIERQKLMAKFTLGLMYDLSGLPERALGVLTTDTDLARWPDDPSKAVLHLFIGRQHLYLRQTDDAQRAFEEALRRDPGYLRAHLGLGDAHYQRVAMLPADQRLDSPELDQAIGEYQFVIERAAQAVDAPLLALSAQLSLGYGRALKGGALYQRDQMEPAETELLAAVDLLSGALDALAGQYRRLGQAYEAIGRSYIQLADIADARGDTAEGKRRYDAARAALQSCQAQGEEGRGLSDEFLVNNIIRAVCLPNLNTITQALSNR